MRVKTIRGEGLEYYDADCLVFTATKIDRMTARITLADGKEFEVNNLETQTVTTVDGLKITFRTKSTTRNKPCLEVWARDEKAATVLLGARPILSSPSSQAIQSEALPGCGFGRRARARFARMKRERETSFGQRSLLPGSHSD